MAIQFKPKSERELSNAFLWPEGIYDFEVIKETHFGTAHFATGESTSKKGNPTIHLVLRLTNAQGQTTTVIDYLTPAGRALRKLRHAAISCGLEADYEAGALDAARFIGSTGRLKLAIEKSKNNQYPDRNVVTDYVSG